MFRFFLLPPLLLLAISIAGVFRGGFFSALAPWPFAIAVLVIGLPHGAVDLKLAAKLEGVSLQRAALRSTWYLLLMIVIILGLWVVPTPTLISFALVSAWHFGRADVADHTVAAEEYRKQTGQPEKTNSPSTLATERLPSVVRGLFILTLPFAFHVNESVAVASELVEMCGSKFHANLNLIQVVATGLTGVCLTFELIRGFSFQNSGRGYVGRLILLEVAALAAAFSILHPLFAMGLYFGAWHSWRHLRRLGEALHFESQTNTLAVVIRLHRESLPLLIPTLLVIWVLCLGLKGEVNVWNVALTSLLVYAVVTLPHEVLCSRLLCFLKQPSGSDNETASNSGVGPPVNLVDSSSESFDVSSRWSTKTQGNQ